MQPAIFLIHGITKTPEEWLPLKRKLETVGVHVETPTLPGHGTCKQGYGTCIFDFLKTSYEDWKAAMLQEYREFEKAYPVNLVGGVSLGATIALYIAAECNPRGVVTLNAPVYVTSPLKIGSAAMSAIKRFLPSKEGRTMYHHVPVNGLLSMKEALKEVRQLLPRIEAPILILQGVGDDLVLPRSAKFIFAHVRSSYKKVGWLKNIAHGIDSEEGVTEVFDHITQMLREIDLL